MHETALKSCLAEGRYLPLSLTSDNIEIALKGLFALGFSGLNVTAPHKRAVMPFLESLSLEAEKIGAVNTLLPGLKSFRGFNTDHLGFSEAYLTGLNPSQALVIGSGGAARAVLQALNSKGFKPTVASRNLVKGYEIAKQFEANFIDFNNIRSFGPWPLAVNASSASSPEELGPNPPLIGLRPGSVMVDVNYGRQKNVWRDQALKSEAVFKDGLGMLALQARESFKIWTSLDPGADCFLSSLENFTGHKT
jgi:shikimate dehydrogenase